MSSKLEIVLNTITDRMIARQLSMEAQTAKSYLEQCADAWEAMKSALEAVKAKERPEAYKTEVKRQETRFLEATGEKPGITRLIGIHWLVQLVKSEQRKGIKTDAITPWAWREFVVFLEQDDKDGNTYLSAPYVWKEEPTDDNAKDDESAKEEALELLEEVSGGKMTTREVMEAKGAIVAKYFPNAPARGKRRSGAVAPGGDPAKKGVNLVVRQISKGLESKGAIRRAAFQQLAEKKAVRTTDVIGILQGMDAAGELTLADIQKISAFLQGIAIRMNDESGADDEQEEQEAPAPSKGGKGKKAAAAA